MTVRKQVARTSFARSALLTRTETHDENIASAGGYYPAKSLSTVFMGRYIRFCVSGKERNPYLE